MASFCFAQVKMVDFQVIDSRNDQPLIGASLAHNTQGAITDINGMAQLLLAPGDTVVISYIGYQSVSYNFKRESSLKEIIRLQPVATLLTAATVTSSRHEKPLAESTVSLDILTADFLERNGATEIEDALNRMPGVQIIDGQANIRGGSGWSYGAGSRVMLLMDDMPLLQVDAATTNWADLPLENIGAVEIVKGAASALYGSSALNGVIHFRTNYAKSEPETEIAVQSTLYDMPSDSSDYRTSHNTLISVVHRRKIDKLDMVLGGFYRNEESFRQGMLAKFGRASAQFRYRFTDSLMVGVNAMYVPGISRTYFYWDAPGSFRGNAANFNQNDRLRYNIDPYVKWKTGYWTHKAQGRYYFIDNQNDDNQGNQSDMLYGEYQSQYAHPYWGLNLSVGAVHQYTRSISELYSDTTFYNFNTAAYVQVDQDITDRLLLSGGVRWERNELRFPEVLNGDTLSSDRTVESKPIFRLGLNYQFFKATYLRASWGQGYRFPSIAEKFISTNAGGLDIRPNPDLESETGWTAEIGLRQGLAGDQWNGYFDFSLFRSEYDNMMEFGAAQSGGFPFFISRNVGGVRIDGVEFNGFFTLTRGAWSASTQFGLTLLNPRFLDWSEEGIGARPNDPELNTAELNAANSTATDDVLKYRNRVNLKWDAQVGYLNYFAGFNVNRTSPMLAVDRVLALFIPGLENDGNYNLSQSEAWVMDVRTGWKGDGFKIQCIAKNIWDERYWSRPGFLEAPRSYTLRLDVSF